MNYNIIFKILDMVDLPDPWPPVRLIIFVPFLKKTRITFNDDEVKTANSKETLEYTLDLIKQDQLVS